MIVVVILLDNIDCDMSEMSRNFNAREGYFFACTEYGEVMI